MSEARPYMFDVDFSKQDFQPKETEIEEEAPPPPMFSEAELNEARDQSYESGHAAGLAEATTGIEQHIAQNSDVMVAALSQVVAEQHRANEQTTKQAILVAKRLVEKLMPEMVRQNGADEIEAVVTDTLETMLEAAQISVFVHPDLQEEMSERLKQIAAQTNLNENLSVHADDSLGLSDCRMEWGSGNARRVVDETWQKLSEAVDRNVASSLASPPTDTVGEAPAPQAADAAPVMAQIPDAPTAPPETQTTDAQPAEAMSVAPEEDISADIPPAEQAISVEEPAADAQQDAPAGLPETPPTIRNEPEMQPGPVDADALEIADAAETPTLTGAESAMPLPGAIETGAVETGGSDQEALPSVEGDVMAPVTDEPSETPSGPPVLPGAIDLEPEPVREDENSS